MTDPTNDIDALRVFLEKVGEGDPMRCDAEDARPWSKALTALVAERDALRKRVSYLEALSKPLYMQHGQRVESIDLRERLVCAIWPQILHQYRASTTPFDPFNDAREDAVIEADKMIAEMRKGGGA